MQRRDKILSFCRWLADPESESTRGPNSVWCHRQSVVRTRLKQGRVLVMVKRQSVLQTSLKQASAGVVSVVQSLKVDLLAWLVRMRLTKITVLGVMHRLMGLALPRKS